MLKKIIGIPSHTRRFACLAFALVLGACSPKPTSSAQPAASGKAPPPQGTEQSRLKIGDIAPMGQVMDSAGQPINLAETWAGKSSVVVFYRGHW